MELSDYDPGFSGAIPQEEASFQVLWKNTSSARKVVHSLVNGKHIDQFMAEEFRFLEDYPKAWEDFFHWLGYRLRRSELGGSPFFFLESHTELVSQARLSRGATFLGLYMAWHFFMQGPGEPDHLPAEEIFRRLVSSYPFVLLRSVFSRRPVSLAPVEMSEDQAEKLRAGIRRDLIELARYRFIDLAPNGRAAWQDLVVVRLPALYRFWELALHVRSQSGNGHEQGIDEIVAEIWGSIEAESEEDEQ
jgi:hypothetical protein